MTNKTPEEASELPTTVKFIRDTLGVTELEDDHLRILFNFAFSHLKYLNGKIAQTSMSSVDKKNQSKAADDIWQYVMELVTVNRTAKRSHTLYHSWFDRHLKNILEETL